MRLFIRHFFLFVLPCVVTFYSLELFAESEQNLYVRKKQILTQKLPLSTAVLGSSHSFFGVKIDSIDSQAYNFSWPSQTLEESLFLAQTLDNKCTVLLSISPHTLRSTNENRPEIHRNVLFNRIFNPNFLTSTHQWSFFWSLGGKKTLKMAKNGFNEIGRPCCNPQTGDGSCQGHSKSNFEESAQEAAERHLENSLQKKNLDILKSVPELGLKVRLFTTPFHESYRDLVNSDSIWKFTKELCNTISLESTLVSYEDWSDLALPDSAFWDADHLNDYGAEIFSKKLFGPTALDSLENALQLP